MNAKSEHRWGSLHQFAVAASSLSLLACLPLYIVGFGSALAAQPDKSLPDSFLREAAAKMETRLFGGEDLAECQLRLARSSKEDRFPFILILAQYHRLLEKQPNRALQLLAPVVLGEAKAAEWVKEQAAGEKEAVKKWQEDLRRAQREKADQLPEPPLGPFAPFPPPSEWRVSEANIACAIEAAHCLAGLRSLQDALAIINDLGAKFEHVPRALAAEAGGDLMVRLQCYQKAHEFYEFGIKVLDAAVSYFGEKYTEDQKALKSRLECKLAAVRRLLDIEKYGKGWIAYRDAEQKRRMERAFLEALLAYEDIRKEFTQTIWAEAATACSVKCLLALAELEHGKRAGESIKRIEQQKQERQSVLKQAVKANVPEPARKELEAAVDQVNERLRRMKAVAKGAEAWPAAEALAREFLEENEFGLYRGEVLADLAAHALEQRLEPQAAESLYRRAWDWLAKVDSMEAAWGAFDVPGKAKEVSAAPPIEEKAGSFGNFKRSELRVGAVVNRRTCVWYLDDLRERCALALGFVEFWKGNKAAAIEWYAMVVPLDKKTGFLQQKGEWNNYSRLTWGAEHGYLYAHPEELALYQGRQRFVLLLADFFFVTERFDRAVALHERLLGGEFGKLSSALADYPQYALGTCAFWTGDRKRAYGQYMKVLAKKDGTFTESRAMYAAGNISADLDDPAVRARGMDLLRDLATSGQNNDFVFQAMILYGKRLVKAGKRDEGLRALKAVPKTASGYFELAQMYAGEYEGKGQERSGK